MTLSRGSILTRLAVALLSLAVIDAFIPAWLAHAERARYEGSRVFRFTYSDIFAFGPFVEYLRDHPVGTRPRVVFLGTSVVWGYRLREEDSIPNQFAARAPSAQVLNFAAALTGLGTDGGYLVVKDIIDAVDVVYVYVAGVGAHPRLGRLIPVEKSDVEEFALEAPDPLERRLQEALSFWKLYRYSYRVQAALFGTSTRNFVYSHKTTPFRSGAAPPQDVAREPDDVARGVVPFEYQPVSATTWEACRGLEAADPWLWRYAQLVRTRAKRAVFYKLGLPGERSSGADWNAMNGCFRGSVAFITARAPRDRMIDHVHLSPSGSRAVAEMLHTATVAAFGATRAVH
jgi:hypothetical protein